MNMSEAPNDQ